MGVLGIVFALAAAVIGGFAAAVLPWWLIVALLILPILAISGVLFPEFALVGLFILICGLVPEALAPQITIGPGVVKAHELAILLLAGFALVRIVGRSSMNGYLSWLYPIIAFFLLTIIGIVVGKLHGASLRDALSDGRVVMAWLIAFIVPALVQREAQLNRLIGGIVVVGLLIALALILQSATGKPIIQNARVEALVTLNEAIPDVTRSTAGGGIYVVVFSCLLLLGLLITGSIPIALAILLLATLVAGIVVTFGRGVWIASVFVALLLAFRLGKLGGIIKLTIVGISGCVLGLALIASFKPAVIEVVVERVLSTTQETLERNTTLGWRAEENRFAFASIASSPVFGIGMGTAYKPLTRMNGVTVTESDIVLTRYIHNAYLGLWLKFGIAGVFTAAWVCWITFVHGSRLLKHCQDQRHKALAASCVAAFLVPVITSVTQPEWLTQTGIAFFALMIGVLICLHRISLAREVMSASQDRKSDHSAHLPGAAPSHSRLP